MRRGLPVSSPWPARALVVLRVCLGIFLIAKSTGKFGWLFDSTPLTDKLTTWSAKPDAIALSRAYAHFLLPGAPIFARLALVGELGAGIALVAGFQTRAIAALAALMILNFHLATGGLVSWDFLFDPSGFVVVSALAAVALGAQHLPLSVTR